MFGVHLPTIPPFFLRSVTHSAWILRRLMQNQMILEIDAHFAATAVNTAL
jgi:hypothetical protein